jgi:hypothetical protein
MAWRDTWLADSALLVLVVNILDETLTHTPYSAHIPHKIHTRCRTHTHVRIRLHTQTCAHTHTRTHSMHLFPISVTYKSGRPGCLNSSSHRLRARAHKPYAHWYACTHACTATHSHACACFQIMACSSVSGCHGHQLTPRRTRRMRTQTDTHQCCRVL